ncbi:MAG TPA: polymer-forming cytoskeletal protein [Patescibacteria group bacterium]
MNRERPIAGPGTIIGGNVVLTGILKDAGDIAIHGKIEGEVTSERSIVIGETADVKGPVSGQIVTVAGTIRGSVDAGQKLEILPTGKIFGSISTRELIVRSGAVFIGKSTMPLEENVEEAHDESMEHSARMNEYEHAGHAVVEED